MRRWRGEHILAREHAAAIGEERYVATRPCNDVPASWPSFRRKNLQINCRLAHFEVRGIRHRRVPINHKCVVFGLDVITMERKGP